MRWKKNERLWNYDFYSHSIFKDNEYQVQNDFGKFKKNEALKVHSYSQIANLAFRHY